MNHICTSIGYIPSKRDITGHISFLAGTYIFLFIPCLGYSDLGRSLSLPTEPKWCTFSALDLMQNPPDLRDEAAI